MVAPFSFSFSLLSDKNHQKRIPKKLGEFKEMISKTLLLQSRRGLASKAQSFSLPESSFAMHNCPSPELTVSLTKEEGLGLYRTMVNIRRIETASDQVFLLFCCAVFMYTHDDSARHTSVQG